MDRWDVCIFVVTKDIGREESSDTRWKGVVQTNTPSAALRHAISRSKLTLQEHDQLRITVSRAA